VPRVWTPLLVVLVTGVLAAGCGEPREVTYVDPNGAERGVQSGDGGEPIARHGTAAIERAKACVRLRASLGVARTLAVSQRDVASEVIERAVVDDLAFIEPRATSSAPAVAVQLRTALEQLRDAPPATIAAYNLAVRRIADDLLLRACDAAVPPAARQDSSFRAALLYETLLHAATSYEAAFDGGATVTAPDEYRLAYGLLVDASTRQVESIPEDARPRIRGSLDRITRRATPGPTPPPTPWNSEVVLGDLSAVADDVATSARIDPTYPTPDPATPDQLRTLQRSVAAAVEARERGTVEDALRQLRTADRASLVPSASGIASVSPLLLAEIEHDLLVELPEAIRSGGDVTSVAAQLDVRLDEAISLVEEELALLRDAE
jgi:hypothetical protein